MKQQLCIMQIIPGFATNEGAGGSALFGIELARKLDPTRFRSVICGIYRYNTVSETRWLNQLAEEGIETRILVEKSLKVRYDLIRSCAFLNIVINSLHVDIMHTHIERIEAPISLLKLIQRPYPKLIRTLHIDRVWVTRPIIRALMSMLYTTLFSNEVAISSSTKNLLDHRLLARLLQRKSTLVHNSLPSERLIELDRLKQHVSFAPPRFIVVGRLEEQKGHVDFLEAAHLMLQHYPEARFWIVGAGSLAQTLQQQAAGLGISHAVEFLGARNDIPELLSQVDVLVSTSWWEGFPTVILEAMAARLPVVATAISGSRELVAPYTTGVLAPKGDVIAISRAMIWMIEHQEEAQILGQNGWMEVQQYTMERTAVHYEQLYDQAMELEYRS